MDSFHYPVLLQVACDYLTIKKNDWYLDATLGGGGHTAEILHRGGNVIALDQDQDAIDYCLEKFKQELKNGKLKIVKSAFSHLDEVLGKKFVSGALFDLGVSMHQLQKPSRGFSFQQNGPLDMRMDQDLNQTALSLIHVLTPKQLNHIFQDYGEIQNGFHLAERIVTEKPETTEKLVQIINDRNLVRPLFQALRIAVNSELFELETALPKAFSHLSPGGRLVVISFHSLEDRIVKNFPYGTMITKNPIQPGPEEVKVNPASKSAKLRAILKSYD